MSWKSYECACSSKRYPLDLKSALKTSCVIFPFPGRKLIDKRVEELIAQSEEEPQGAYLTYLLSSGKLTIEEVSGSVAELLMAGVDTVGFVFSCRPKSSF